MNGGKLGSLVLLLLAHPKTILMAIGSPFLLYLGATNLVTALSETSATEVKLERFAENYRGHRWLHVEGRLLPEFAWVKPSNNGFVNVYVPLVPLDWKNGQAIHVVRSFSLQGERLALWKADTTQAPQCSLTGMIGPLGAMRYWDMFPTLHFEEPVVYVNDGGVPDPPWLSIFLVAVGMLFLILSWPPLSRDIICWWRQ